jgi:excisionase family DNA binding protein
MCSKAYVSFKGLMKYTSCSRSMLRFWIDNGMPFYRLGPRCNRVKLSEFDEWVKKFRSGTDDTSHLETAWNQVMEEVYDGIPD